jgi:hypothetical protein
VFPAIPRSLFAHWAAVLRSHYGRSASLGASSRCGRTSTTIASAIAAGSRRSGYRACQAVSRSRRALVVLTGFPATRTAPGLQVPGAAPTIAESVGEGFAHVVHQARQIVQHGSTLRVLGRRTTRGQVPPLPERGVISEQLEQRRLVGAKLGDLFWRQTIGRTEPDTCSRWRVRVGWCLGGGSRLREPTLIWCSWRR